MLCYVSVPVHFVLKVLDIKIYEELSWFDLDVPLNRYWTSNGCYLIFLVFVIEANIDQFITNHAYDPDLPNESHHGVYERSRKF